jgi:radical SAM protein with 4Fe4S-binding SPASM domain
MIQRLINPANVLQAAFSYLRSSLTGNSSVTGMPLSVNAELTNNCNLRCPECSSGSGLMQRDRGFMDIELFKKVIIELKPYLCNINLYFQGEPMMHPDFFAFVGSSPKAHTVVSTNGHFLSAGNAEKIVKSGLGKLIISLDGIDQETYSAYRRNGHINTVIDGIRRIAEAKKRFSSSLKVEIQVLVNKLNEQQIPQIRVLAKSVKATLKLKSMQILKQEDIGSWLPLNEIYSRYRKKKEGYVIKNSLSDSCARLWFNPVITWDGKVIPCCFDKNAEFVMGDLNHDSFREIWNGPKYRIFRKSIMSGRYMVEMCRNCTSGIRGVKY